MLALLRRLGRVGLLLAIAGGLLVPLAAPAGAVPAPFACSPKFYQVTATNGGAFYQYSAAANSFSRLGTSAASGINGIGYNPADNFVYGVASSKLYRIDSAGSYSTGTTLTGSTISVGGGDFYDGSLIVAPTSGNSWRSINVTTAASSTFALTGAANGNASSTTWGAYDLTVQGDLAYGLNGTSLYIVKMDTQQVSERTITGTGSSTGAYGAAYSDSSGNAFFYNNGDNRVYELTAAELAKATGSSTAPAAVLVGGGASTPALTAPNDGASCPNAVSPYVPTIVDPATSSAVTTTSAVLTGNAVANNASTTTGFCYGTGSTLATCTSVSATPGTISGSTQQQFTATLSALSPSTTYYYRIVATNTVGTNLGQIYSFTTNATPKTAQTITFPALDDMTVPDDPQDLGATSSSGLTVAYSSLTPLVCTITGSTVVPVAAGTCTVAADQAGDATYDPATQVTRSFTVSLGEQTITFPALDDMAVTDSPQDLDASSTSELTVTYSSLTPLVCTVTGSTVVPVAVGTCTVAADQAGDSSYDAATQVTKSFTVSLGEQTITFPALDDMAVTDSPQDLDASSTSELTVTYSSLTPLVCTVTGSTVVPVAVGTCTVAADQAGDSSYDAATQVTKSFTVSLGEQTISFPALDDMTVTDSPQDLDASSSSELTVTYTSLTPLVCTITGSTVQPIAAGTCTVAADQAGDSSYDAATQVTKSFTVSLSAQTISFPALDDMTVTDSPQDLGASSSSELTVTYTSLTPLVCTVTGSTVVPVGAGTCTVAADQAGDSSYDAATQVTKSFTVSLSAQTITFPALDDMTVSDSPQDLNASSSSSELTVTYTSLTPLVCTVTGSTVVPVGAGTCTVAADQAGDSSYDAATQVTRSFTVTPIQQTIVVAPIADITFGQTPVGPTASVASGLPLAYTSLTPAVCSIASGGTALTALEVGICTIRVSQGGDATHAAATPVSVSFEVGKAAQTVLVAHVDDIAVDQGPAHVSVTASGPSEPQLESLTPSVCTVGTDGAVNLVSTGTCTIRATVAGNANYLTAQQQVSFQVLAPFAVPTPPPVATRQGDPISISIPASGGVGPYTWAVAPAEGNRLPDGLTLDPTTGAITGTPRAPGDYTVIIEVTDAAGQTIARTVHLVVSAAGAVAAPSGTRSVVAGGRFWLPDSSVDGETWTYDLPASFHPDGVSQGKRWYTVSDRVSGLMVVALHVVSAAATATGDFQVAVHPQTVAEGSYRLSAGAASTLKWQPRPGDGVRGYRVFVDGTLVGRTTQANLTLHRLLGPHSRVEVRTEGNDSLHSGLRRLGYHATARPVALVVHYGTSSAALDHHDLVLLQGLVRAIRSAGLQHAMVAGFTDSRGSVASNQVLSVHRATAVRAYLTDHLPGLAVAVVGRSEHLPVATNSTPSGMADNRRAEIRVW